MVVLRKGRLEGDGKERAQCALFELEMPCVSGVGGSLKQISSASQLFGC